MKGVNFFAFLPVGFSTMVNLWSCQLLFEVSGDMEEFSGSDYTYPHRDMHAPSACVGATFLCCTLCGSHVVERKGIGFLCFSCANVKGPFGCINFLPRCKSLCLCLVCFPAPISISSPFLEVFISNIWFCLANSLKLLELGNRLEHWFRLAKFYMSPMFTDISSRNFITQSCQVEAFMS